MELTRLSLLLHRFSGHEAKLPNLLYSNLRHITSCCRINKQMSLEVGAAIIAFESL